LGRYERFGNPSDIDNSILEVEEAVRLAFDGHPDRPLLLNSLGNSLMRRFERLGDLSDIKTSISVFEKALQLTPDDQPSPFNNLGAFTSL
jgi:hypothetical protein